MHAQPYILALAASLLAVTVHALPVRPANTIRQAGTFTLPDPPYPTKYPLPAPSLERAHPRPQALGPHLSKETMQLHHGKHHAAYVASLAAATAAQGVAGVVAAVGFNGGGHINHSLFWAGLARA